MSDVKVKAKKDPELKSVNVIANELAKLTPVQAHRVLKFVYDRYNDIVKQKDAPAA